MSQIEPFLEVEARCKLYNLNKIHLILSLVLLFSFPNFAEDIKACNCTDGFVEYCKYDDSRNFIGFCSEEKGRQIGKTFYQDGVTFEGNYYDDLYSVGTMTWSNGNSLRGEFFVANAGYKLEDGIDLNKLAAIGQRVEGTITSRGFFEFSNKNKIRLIGFGTEFNTDPAGEFVYRAGSYSDGVIGGKNVVTLNIQAEGQESRLAIWSDLSLPIEDRNLYVINEDSKTVYQFVDDKTQFIRDFTPQDDLAKTNLEKSIENKKTTLDQNFKILDERLTQVEDFLSGEGASKESTHIKPLSSELVRSIQELLTILGYETGKIDGILGPLTVAGIKAFERKNNKTLKGKPSEELLISLQESVRLRNNELARSEEPPKELPVVSTGTGFFVNQNHLVTNYHVVQKCNYLSIQKMGLLSIETQDQVNDIAVLRSNDESKSFLRLSDNPQLGQLIFTGGYPYNDLLDNFNFTIGNISSLRGTQSNISQFQFTAPVQPGSSGGPILNDRGGVVGVTVSGLGASFAEKRNTLPQNIAFGIKVGVVKDILYEEGTRFTEGQEFWFTPTQEKIAQLAKDSSVVIQCHSSL